MLVVGVLCWWFANSLRNAVEFLGSLAVAEEERGEESNDEEDEKECHHHLRATA